MIYQEYSESLPAIVAGATYNVPIPESFTKHGPANELVVSISGLVVEELEIFVGETSFGLFGAGGFLVIERKDKKYFNTLRIKNTSATNTSADEIKVLARRVV